MIRQRQQIGFTLVEMLISMVLLSLLVLGMVSAVRTMGQTQDRIDQRFAHLEQFQSVTTFVQTILGRLSDRRADPQDQQGISPFLFHGTSHSIEWLGVMPARHGMGGRYFFRLAMEPQERVHAVVLRYQPWQGELVPSDWANAAARVLVADVVGFDIEYGGKEMAPQEWVSAWTITESLPVRIRLGVVERDAVWLPWVVATRTLPVGGGRSSMYSTGPGR